MSDLATEQWRAYLQGIGDALPAISHQRLLQIACAFRQMRAQEEIVRDDPDWQALDAQITAQIARRGLAADLDELYARWFDEAQERIREYRVFFPPGSHA